MKREICKKQKRRIWNEGKDREDKRSKGEVEKMVKNEGDRETEKLKRY